MVDSASPLDLLDRSRDPDNITRTLATSPKDTSSASQPQRVSLVLTYNPALRYVSSTLHKHFNILFHLPAALKFTKLNPLLLSECLKTLSNLLVNAKLCKAATITNQPGHFKGKMVSFAEL